MTEYRLHRETVKNNSILTEICWEKKHLKGWNGLYVNTVSAFVPSSLLHFNFFITNAM